MGLKHRIHHGLAVDLAKRAIEKAMAAYSERFAAYDPTFTWQSETRGRVTFEAKGMTVEGEVELIGAEVTVELTVPFILRIFRRKAIAVIDREVRAWCEKARRGELD